MALVLFGLSAYATDLTWVNWSGDLKASTAANWSPAQVPQAGDNLYIYYDGTGTKYWHNDLNIEYGHIDLVITNTSSSRVDFDQQEVRVTNGFSFLGNGGTFYPRTAITGSGEMYIDNSGGVFYLPTSPTSGRTYTGDVMIRRGTFSPQAADILGTEQQHGKITICAPVTASGQYGSLTPNGTWTMWNEIYYDNTSSAFAFQPGSGVEYRGAWYFTGGNGTVQKSGGSSVRQYGGIYKWTPDGRATRTDCVIMFVIGDGIVLNGGYTDAACAMELWSNVNTLVTVNSDLDLPLGVKFRGEGRMKFTKDLTTESGLQVSMASGSPVMDLCGTTQRLGKFTLAAAVVAPVITNSSSTTAKVLWMPAEDCALGPTLAGSTSLTLDAAGITGTLASTLTDGDLKAENGTLVIPTAAEMPNVRSLEVASGAMLSVASDALNPDLVVRLASGATLDLASGVVLKAFKAYDGDTRLAPGDYQYGSGTLRVANPVYAWTGAAGDNDPTNPENWNYREVPTTEDNVIIASSDPVALTAGLTVATLTLGADLELTLPKGALLKANSFVFNSGVSIAAASGSATLEFSAAGSYASLPALKDVVVKSSGGVVTFTDDTIGDGKLNLETSGSGDFAVASGLSLPVFTYKRSGNYVNPGSVSAGEGTLVVYTRPASPAAEWSVWTGEGGSEDESIFADVNWQGGVAPNLASGDAKLRFPDGAVVAIPTGSVRAYQLDFQGSTAMYGEGKLMLGAGGAHQVNSSFVAISNDVEFTAVPVEWQMSGASAKLEFCGAFGAHDALPADGKVSFVGDGNPAVKYGLGNIYFRGKCADPFNAEVVVSNVIANIKHGETFSALRGVSIWSKGYDFTQDPHLFAEGLLVEFPVFFYGHRKELSNSTGPNGNIVTFNKPVYFYIDTDVNGTEAVSITCRNSYFFNAPVYANGTFNLYNGELPAAQKQYQKQVGTFFNDTLTIVGSGHRLYLSGANAFTHFAKSGSVLADVYGVNGAGINISCEGENVFDPNQMLLFYNRDNGVHLNGYDQNCKAIWCNYGSAVNVVITNGAEYGVAVLRMNQANAWNNLRARWMGTAGAQFDMAANKSLDWREGVSVTRGPLIVTGGTLNFLDTARWHGSGEVQISNGAKITTSSTETFGDATDGYKAKLRVANGGVLKLGANETVRNLYYNDEPMPKGTYGASGSGAQYEVSWLAESTGQLTVLKDPPAGFMLLIE